MKALTLSNKWYISAGLFHLETTLTLLILFYKKNLKYKNKKIFFMMFQFSINYYVLNQSVLLLIMPSCCKGGWMATHLTCITTIIRTQHSQREDRSTRTLHTPTQTLGSDFKQENQNQRLLYLQQGRVGTKYIRPE